MNLIMIKENLIFPLHILKIIALSIPFLKPIILRLESRINQNLFNLSSKDIIQKEILRVEEIYNQILNRIKEYDRNFSFKNKTILEIGPGNNLLLAFLFITAGAKKVYLVDKFHRMHNSSYDFKIYNLFLKNFHEDRDQNKEKLNTVNPKNLFLLYHDYFWHIRKHYLNILYISHDY